MAINSYGQFEKKSFDKRGNEGKRRGIKGLPKFLKNLDDCQVGGNTDGRKNPALARRITAAAFVSDIRLERSKNRGSDFGHASALMRAESREIFRDAVFLCTTPFFAPRMISGCAAMSAAWAAVLSPPAIDSSTFFIEVRIRLRRSRLISVRRSDWRTRFFADGEFAIFNPFQPAPGGWRFL
jgi:hypothetical protein